jgi:hypothetical protein
MYRAYAVIVRGIYFENIKGGKMKTKHFFNMVMAALIAVIFSVLSGCPTGNDDPTAEELAEQLAADINAVEAGSAAVNGTLVKLAGDTFVAIPIALTVPAGVTLDVTADGAALGLGSQAVDNTPVTLTVNGTVIARPGHVQLEDCQWGAATINGSGVICLHGNGRLLDVSGNWNAADRKIILDGVTLVGLKDNDQALVYVDKGGEVVMKSGVITGNGDWGVSIQEGGTVNNPYDNNNIVTFIGGTFTMEGGTISGNSGGGVNIHIAGGGYTFTVEGGPVTVTNDAAKGTGTFTMNSPAVAGASGNISGNTRAGQAGNVYNDGGTVNGTANPNPNSITNGLLW